MSVLPIISKEMKNSYINLKGKVKNLCNNVNRLPGLAIGKTQLDWVSGFPF